MPNPPVELKKCALCGGEAESSTGSTKGNPWEFVECTNCGATSESITLWNTRPIEAALTARVGVLEEAGKWVLNVIHGVGKAGGPPCNDEAGAAFESLKAALAEGGGD